MKNTVLSIAAIIGLVAFAGSAEAARGFSAGHINLRAGPDRGYPVIAQIPANAYVAIEGCVNDWSWCDVRWSNIRGWVAGEYLRTGDIHRPAYIADSGRTAHIPVVEFNLGNYWDNYYHNRPFYKDRDRYSHIGHEHDDNRNHDHDWNDHRGNGHGRWNR